MADSFSNQPIKYLANSLYKGIPTMILNGNVTPKLSPRYIAGFALGIASFTTAGTAIQLALAVNTISNVALPTEKLKFRDASKAMSEPINGVSKAKAIRFSTLESICKVLNCQPGDILEYKPDESFPEDRE